MTHPRGLWLDKALGAGRSVFWTALRWGLVMCAGAVVAVIVLLFLAV